MSKESSDSGSPLDPRALETRDDTSWPRFLCSPFRSLPPAPFEFCILLSRSNSVRIQSHFSDPLREHQHRHQLDMFGKHTSGVVRRGVDSNRRALLNVGYREAGGAAGAMDTSSDEGMEMLPDALQQHILGFVRGARDVASCSCVSKKWKEAMTQARSLYFSRNVGDERGILPDLIVTRMVLSMTALQELTVYSPFSNVSLLAWLAHTKDTLKVLELRVDDFGHKRMGNGSISKLGCVALSTRLHTLRLWAVLLTSTPPEWRCFHNLRTLEIVGARLRDSALCGILHACPHLTNLTALGCEGIRVACIELEQLTHCRLDLYGAGDCIVSVIAPKLQVLEVQGASWLRINGNHCLSHLSVANNSGKVKKLDVGRLPDLQSLTLRGVHWHWEAVNSVLQSATELEELSMRVEFCGDADKLEPFPEIDFVDFFNNHSKLRSFEAQGALFAAVANRNSLKQLGPTTVIPSLEEAWVTIRSPLNADQKLASLEALVRCSPRLRRLHIRLSQMKNCEPIADEFFARVLGLKFRYDSIEVQ